MTFDTEPLSEDVEILGAPVVELRFTSDRPVAQVAARLCVVDPEGRSSRVTYGVLNLTHRDSHAAPEALVPGQPTNAEVRMNEIAQRIPAGHRLRLALSSSYWPLIWPAPEPFTLSIDCSASTVQIPLRPHRDSDDTLGDLGSPTGVRPAERTTLEAAKSEWTVSHQLDGDVHTLEVVDDSGVSRLDATGLEIGLHAVERYSITGDDPASARGEVVTRRTMAREEWGVESVTTTVLSSTPTHFVIRAEVVAKEGDAEVFRREWYEEVPRDLV